MKHKIPENISHILSRSRKIAVNRNERFWTDTVDYLNSVIKGGEHPDFLVSWVREILSVIKEKDKVNLLLVFPEDGCWGINIEGKDNYIFSYNENVDVYISYRLYKYLKEKNEYKLLAGLLLHEIAEYLMRFRAEKKGITVDMGKNHGEAMRLEKQLLGKGNQAETLLRDTMIYLANLELERRRVTLDKSEFFVEGCIIKGEEIIAEISSFKYTEETFMVQLTPGQKKVISYSEGSFTAKAEDYIEPFKPDMVNFENYCRLMEIIDDYFIEETVIWRECPFKELLDYIKGLSYSKEEDSRLLELLYLFTGKRYNKEIQRHKFLYNMFIIIDEYMSYIVMRDIIKQEYWQDGNPARDNLTKIADEVYKTKLSKLPAVFFTEKEGKTRLKKRIISWFSDMNEIPSCADMDKYTLVEDIPLGIEAYYKKTQETSIISCYTNDISAELLLHEEVLKIIQRVNSLSEEERGYIGIKRGHDKRVCELGTIRIHFWEERGIFNRGDVVRVFSDSNESKGLAEVIEIKEKSIIVFLKDEDTEITSVGYVKKILEEDTSAAVSLDAIKRLKTDKRIYEKIFYGKNAAGAEEIEFFNNSIKDDTSQSNAVRESLSVDPAVFIQGPPGTGKTTTIAEIILQLLKKGKKVLLASQTNNAVDNALKEVQKWKMQDMGIGRAASKEEKIADNEVRKLWIRNSGELEAFEEKYGDGYVIGATNVGTHSLSMMKGREFDVLVMDEAGKANLVESFMPMLLVKENGKFVIVGDQKQGIPFAYDDDIVELFIKKEEESHERLEVDWAWRNNLKEILNKSLFERIVESGRKTILLNINYRSTPDIVRLVSKLFYKNKIIPYKKPPEKAKSVIIVDTSKKGGADEIRETEIEREGRTRGYKNTFEARLVAEELREILKYKYISTGIRTKYISGVTILTPYIYQVEEIRRQISFGLAGGLPGAALEDILNNVSTIDSFQGREDEVVIISFTRSNDNPREVGFLKELNRINVALSRAKRKMVLIGDFKTLTNVKKGENADEIREIFRMIYDFR